jgi:hypothetical protein
MLCKWASSLKPAWRTLSCVDDSVLGHVATSMPCCPFQLKLFRFPLPAQCAPVRSKQRGCPSARSVKACRCRVSRVPTGSPGGYDVEVSPAPRRVLDWTGRGLRGVINYLYTRMNSDVRSCSGLSNGLPGLASACVLRPWRHPDVAR